MARDTAITPLIRPSSTKPPPRSTLRFSPGKSGLWSIDKSFAFFLVANTQRESPEFAQYISF
jgi:hypothetical protein